MRRSLGTFALFCALLCALVSMSAASINPGPEFYAFMESEGGTKAALFSTAATTNVTGVAPPCFGAGLYHLSCYGGTATGLEIVKAKTQCLTAWAATMPDCKFQLDLMGEWSYGCTQFAVYHFDTLACHKSYQDYEKTNPDCALYAEYGLGPSEESMTSMESPKLIKSEAGNRMESVASMTDYVCAEPTAPV
jgi:hypothetical protein